MAEIYSTASVAEIDLPKEVSLDGMFWIDPASLGSVKDLINSARMPTMAIGVESRRADIDLISKDVTAVLADPGDELFTDQQRAIEIGVLYGSMLAQPEARQTGSEDGLRLSREFIETLASSRSKFDLTTENGNALFFMSLRDAEVAYAGSDVLAFCLAATQDHMRYLFNENHVGSERLDQNKLTSLQSLYYAGVLAGALAASGQELPMPRVEITRSMRSDAEPVGVRLEFDADDNLQNAIEYQLRSKYSFHQSRVDGRPSVGIIPCGLQFGPNALSVSGYFSGLSELGSTRFVPIDSLDAVLVEREEHDESTNKTVKLVRSADGSFDTTEFDEDRIVGVIKGTNCISAYDPAHPSAIAIDELVREEMNIEPGGVRYCTDLDLQPELNDRGLFSTVGKTALVAALVSASAWIPDFHGKVFVPNYEVEWTSGVVVSLSILGLYGLGYWISRKLRRGDERSARQFDTVMQGMLDVAPPLRHDDNSGNISS